MSEIDLKQVGEHIAEVSKNARATWFALLGYLAFSLITLMNIRHVDLFKGGDGIPLPLVGVSVEPILYVIFGPPLLLTVHVYFHVHLMKLWSSLPRFAKNFDDQEDRAQSISEGVYPWLIADFALRRGKKPLIDHNPLSNASDIATAILGWLAVPMMLFWFWQISTPLRDNSLTLVLGLFFAISIFVSSTSFGEIVNRIYPNENDWNLPVRRIMKRANSNFSAVLAFLVIFWVSSERTIGGMLNLVAPIDLRLAELSERPSSWLPFDLWFEGFEEDYRLREGIPLREVLNSDQQQAILNEGIARRTAQLSALQVPDYRGQNFEDADLSRSFVAGADFRQANLTNAVLTDAVLEAIDLRQARLEGADFRRAQLQLANLREVNFEGARIEDAQLQLANLSFAAMEGVVLRFSRLDRADLSYVSLEGSDLRFARFDGARLNGARLSLSTAEATQFPGADLVDANLTGVILREANLREADCRQAEFRFSIVDSADLRCAGLTQGQLRLVVGNSETKLPSEIFVRSCIVEDALSEDDRLSLAQSSAGRARLFCQANEAPVGYRGR